MHPANAARTTGDFGERFLDPLLDDPSRFDGAMRTLRSVSLRDFDAVRAAHGAIRAPVTCVRGRRDPYFPVRDCRSMLNEFAGHARLEIVEHAGLMVQEEAPRACADAIRALVARRDPHGRKPAGVDNPTSRQVA